MDKASGAGSAHNPTVAVVNHDVPSDPDELRQRRIDDADANIASIHLKIKRQKEHLAGATKAKKERQREHLAGAEKALAQAIAARKELS